LFIADFGDNRLREVNAAGIITTLAGNGNAGYGGDGKSANDPSVELNMPSGVATDAVGDVFVAGYTNHPVRAGGTDGGIAPAPGTGAPVALGAGGPATAAASATPSSGGTAAAGALFIPDTGGGQVWRVANGVVVTVALPTSLSLSASANPMVTGQSITL